MSAPARRKARRTVDRDGVVSVTEPTSRRQLWALVLGLPVFAGFVFLVVTFREARSPSGASSASSGPEEHEIPTHHVVHAMVAAEPAQADEEALGGGPSEPVTNDETRDAPLDPHSREGIGAFPPPGTKRIKVGLVVPEGFQLPPGYMRHYQTTDNGEMLQAILMFHPDYAPVDARGKPLPVPADRVVPPEMAPAGLPVARLEIPANAYAEPRR